MNNIKTISNIGYEGFVNFKIYEKKKLRSNFTIHNEGHAGLFNFLATCLAGALETASMPKYLSFSISNGTSSKSTSNILYSKITTSGATQETPEAKVTYTWVVPITEFKNLSDIESDAITVTLSNAQDACATATIKNDGDTAEAFTLLTEIIETQNTNYVIVVAWQLTIGNIPTT